MVFMPCIVAFTVVPLKITFTVAPKFMPAVMSLSTPVRANSLIVVQVGARLVLVEIEKGTAVVVDCKLIMYPARLAASAVETL